MWFLLFLFSWEISAPVPVTCLSALFQILGEDPALSYVVKLFIIILVTQVNLKINRQSSLQGAVWKARTNDCQPPKADRT